MLDPIVGAVGQQVLAIGRVTFDDKRIGHGQRLLVGANFVAQEKVRMTKACATTSLSRLNHRKSAMMAKLVLISLIPGPKAGPAPWLRLCEL